MNLPSIFQYLNISARAEDDVLLAVDIDDFVICATGGASGHTFKGRTFRLSDAGGGCFRFGVGLAYDALKGQPKGEADNP